MTALGCYLCLIDKNNCDGNTTTLFLSNGTKEGIASHSYFLALTKLFKIIATIVYEFAVLAMQMHMVPGKDQQLR